MISKPHAAFGFLLLSQTLGSGESYLAEIKDTPAKIHFWVKGRFKNRNITTQQPMDDFVPGTFLAAEDYFSGTFEHTAVGETVLFCTGPMENRGYMPPIRKFSLVAGESIVLPVGTKLFHCEGQMVVNGNAIENPTQVRSASNELAITATTACYGLIFE